MARPPLPRDTAADGTDADSDATPGWSLAEQAATLANRCKKNFRRMHPVFEQQQVGAWRVYDQDVPGLRVTVDWYEGHLVLAEYVRTQTLRWDDWLGTMATAVAEALHVAADHVHVRQRHTGQGPGPRYPRLARTDARIPVREGPLQFLVNLDDHVDTGLFSDHRTTRRRVARDSEGCDVLNLFSYTGAFTVYAAHAGARSTTSVDLSDRYLAWGRDNLVLNGLDGPAHTAVGASVPAFVSLAARDRRRWDVVIVDPPSFSTTWDGRRDFDVLRDHPALLASVLPLVAPGGVLWFSTNHQRFTPSFERLPVRAVQDLTRATIPVDHRNPHVHRVWRMET